MKDLALQMIATSASLKMTHVWTAALHVWVSQVTTEIIVAIEQEHPRVADALALHLLPGHVLPPLSHSGVLVVTLAEQTVRSVASSLNMPELDNLANALAEVAYLVAPVENSPEAIVGAFERLAGHYLAHGEQVAYPGTAHQFSDELWESSVREMAKKWARA